MIGAAALLLAGGSSPSTTVVLTADADTTLYQDDAGSLANGAGNYLFAGTTQQLDPDVSTRRALLHFDIASQVPAGATIESVELGLEMTRSIVTGFTFDLHRLLSDWGEGPSDAGGLEGAGASSEAGDATWIHRFYPNIDWGTPGGDYEATPSASVLVNGVGPYTWGSTPTMVADVQLWLDDPDQNHGWLLRGPETARGVTAKQFGSRENPADNGPRLSVTYSGGALPSEPIPVLPPAGLVLLALALGILALRRLS